ncbi:aldose 1-epimerase [Rhizobium sp. BK529]|uniref:aldose 1-epimerase n=1 Tax=Rhizobium sp. BK529 TaxID=2586983 RepID=UPI00161BD1D4|nr:aldose 1-epimerase [Rhizobium sp. BK529]MBB3594934.1 aldose 1-epimerase [Rhizobium sp. BK529]
MEKLQLLSDELLVEPRCGAIYAWRVCRNNKSKDLFRTPRADATVEADPLTMGCFPLVPYSGPVVGGSFRFGGESFELARTHSMLREPIHGNGWVNEWEIVERSATMLDLRLQYRCRDGFPFKFDARQKLRLVPSGLEAELSVTNADNKVMPAGIGFHPFFPKDSDTTLKAKNPYIWPCALDDANGEAQSTPPDKDFSAGRVLTGLVADDCYSGWNRRATLTWPSRGYQIIIRAHGLFDKLVVFAPKDEDYFCVEPVSNIDNGYNKMAAGVPGHGIRELGVGGTIVGRVRFDVGAASPT